MEIYFAVTSVKESSLNNIERQVLLGPLRYLFSEIELQVQYRATMTTQHIEIIRQKAFFDIQKVSYRNSIFEKNSHFVLLPE